jgi:hypothetical protein
MRPMSRIALLVLLALAATAGTAHAGGWATVELGSPPGKIVAGEPWRVELIVKQHGITPLDGVTPSVRIDDGDGVVRTFEARPAGRPGTYVAEVTYPSTGTWKTRLFDGFTDATPHRLAPIEVTGGSAPASAPGAPWPQITAIAALALLWLAAWIVVSGRPHLRLRRQRGATSSA